MDRGYVKLWRKTLDSGLLMNPTAWQVFGFILLNAAHSPRRLIIDGAVVNINPGEFATGRRRLADALKISEQNVRTAISLLERLEIVTTRSTNRCTIIRIVNWDTYQSTTTTCQPAECISANQQVTSSQPTGNQQVTTKQELKNERIEESINNPPTPLPEDSPFPLTPAEPTPSKRKAKTEKKSAAGKVEYSAEFEELWHIYPNKSNKKGAYKAYLSALENGELPEHTDLIRRVKNRRFEPDWEKEGGRFVPHLQTWLNRSGWEDGGCFDTESRPQKVMPQRLVEAKKEIDEYFQHMVYTSNCKEEADVWKDMWEMNLEVEGCAPWQWSN